MGPGWAAEQSSTWVVLGPPLDLAIERGESVLRDFLGVDASDVELVAGPELLGGEFLSASAQTVRDVAAIEPDLAAVSVDAADDDVHVGWRCRGD